MFQYYDVSPPEPLNHGKWKARVMDSEPGSRLVLDRVGLQLVPVSPLIGPLLHASSSGLHNKPHALRIGDQRRLTQSNRSPSRRPALQAPALRSS